MRFTRNCILLGALLTVTSCSAASTANTKPSIDTTIQTQEVAQVIPQYPSLYKVDIQVCGDILAPVGENGKRCANKKLHLWGPVGEARLLQTDVDMPLLTNLGHGVAITSKGCYPAYKQPSADQFYWVDMTVRVNKGGKALVESQTTLLSNKQVHEIVINKISDVTIQTFGRASCQPADLARAERLKSRKIKVF